MKTTFLTLIAMVLLSVTATGQTATNFNCNDCAGNNHDLFTELDAGKVIVISWVMPCGNCIPPTVTASNIVQSYAGTNPGQVFLYVVDDYANTNCTSLGSWCTANGIIATTFSNAAIDMLDYNSTPGMPKIVVLGGGTSHTVYFNEVNAAAGNAVALQAAIDSALFVGYSESFTNVKDAQLYPNPVSDYAVLMFDAEVSEETTFQIFNEYGQPVAPAVAISVQPGCNRKEIYAGELADGIYFIYLGDGDSRRKLRLVVVH